MAIAFDTAVNATIQNPGTSLTFSHTCTGTNRILFVMAFIRGDVATGVTYAGAAMTKAGTEINDGGDRYSAWFLVNPASGANNVVISGGASTTLVIGCSQSYTGASQTGQPDATTNNGPTNTAALTTSLTTIADNSWVVLFARSDSTGVTSAGTGSTQRSTTAGLVQGYDNGGPKTPAGSVSMQTTTAGSEVTTHLVVSFSPFTNAVVSTHFLSLLGAGL